MEDPHPRILLQLIRIRHNSNFGYLFSFDQNIAVIWILSGGVQDLYIGKEDCGFGVCAYERVWLGLEGGGEFDGGDGREISWGAGVGSSICATFRKAGRLVGDS